MYKLLVALFFLSPISANAMVVSAARTLPAGTVIAADDLQMTESDRAGLSNPEDAIGRQARVTIYEGRAIQASLLQAPRLVARNQIVRVQYTDGPLQITVDGRALSAGGAGDLIRVLNLESRSTITAVVNSDGSLTVSR